MKPIYDITSEIIQSIASISEKIGSINAYYLDKPSPELRKKNKIRTIHSSLKIEGNSLTAGQVTDIINNKRVLGKERDILEVKNALQVYEKMNSFNPYSLKSFLSAHRILMLNLIERPGELRNENVGVFKEKELSHLGPPPNMVPRLMNDLFSYLNTGSDPELIKSCVFHNEIEFIHPFIDGNGRMGRLWQTVILMKKYPLFEFIPVESLIVNSQEEYYRILEICDREGKSTLFVEYMLALISRSLDELIDWRSRKLTEMERLEYFVSLGKSIFSRKDYLDVFKDISTSTASRDLKKGVELNLFERKGDKNNTLYKRI